MVSKYKLLVVAVLLLWTATAYSQSIRSPYSIFGIGDQRFEGLAQNQAMGELGIGYSSLRFINLQNPAWLYRNNLSSFQVALESESRSFATADTRDNGGAAGLRYLAYVIPLKQNRVATSFGILPVTTVNYNILTTDTVAASGAEYQVRYRGSGGLTQVYWSNGVRITKSLAVGIKAKYIFGSIDNENTVLITDPDISAVYTSAFVENFIFNDFNFTAGASYRKRIADQTFINLGLIYDLAANLKGKRSEFLERRNLADQSLRTDTLLFKERAVYQIPNSLGFGFTYEKMNKFSIGVDVKTQDWVSRGGFESDVNTFRRTFKYAIGGELFPEYNDVNSYFKRVAYRAGISFEQLPYLVKDVKINDFGINFGGSFPVGGVSSLDVAFKFGQRGSIENNLIRERYFKFVFGATINDRWFIKRKYD